MRNINGTVESKAGMSRRRALTLMGSGTLLPLMGCSGPASPRRAPPPPSAAEAALHYLSLRELARRIEAREVSPVEITRWMLERIARVDAKLKSYVTVMSESALEEARVAEREIQSRTYRGPLHGVPVALKDLCYTKGVRTMGGTTVLKSFVPDHDGTVVARLRAAGAVVLGKLALTEGAMGGYNPALDVPLNPWNQERWPGISSSGSGVAVAAGLCFAAIGTDTGGSIRFPSSANGSVGLKPTYGRVSRHGVLALAESLDHVGPMARRVSDVALMFDAIAGFDPADPTSLDVPRSQAARELGRGIKGMRIGIDREYTFKGIDGGQAGAIEAALQVLRDLGAEIVAVRMPELKGMGQAWSAICSSEAAAAHAANFPSRASEYGPYFRGFLGNGARVTPEQLEVARVRRAAIGRQFATVLDSVDAMVSPASSGPAPAVTHALQVGPAAELHAALGAGFGRSTEFTMPMNLAGTPSICLPAGFSADGLPYSIQFSGRHLSEPVLCCIADAYEQATVWHSRHPDLETV